MKKALLIAGGVFIVLSILGNIIRTLGKPEITRKTDSFVEQIEKANQSCPIQVAGGAGYVSAIKLEDNNVTYYIHYNEINVFRIYDFKGFITSIASKKFIIIIF